MRGGKCSTTIIKGKTVTVVDLNTRKWEQQNNVFKHYTTLEGGKDTSNKMKHSATLIINPTDLTSCLVAISSIMAFMAPALIHSY
jgi:hypothetical protein